MDRDYDESGSWRPSATMDALRFRAGCLRSVREFFHSRDVLEVETPVAASSGTVDLWIDSFEVHSHLRHQSLWLQTSPEFHMKRLLAAGSGPIWQMSRVFRDEGRGRWHQNEFSMLEWYRPGWSLRDLCTEVEDLVRELVPALPKARWMSFREAFLERAGVDPFSDPISKIRQAVEETSAIVPSLGDVDRDGWLDLLLVSQVEPGLGESEPVFLWGYPPSRAALARLGDDAGNSVALRAEMYWKGIELTNAYDELIDPTEQLHRFQEEHRARLGMGKSTPPIDHGLVQALHHGLPQGAGVALGFDRLVALAMGADCISRVIAFSED